MFAGVLFFEFAPPVMANEILRMVANVVGGITGLYVWAIGQLLMVVIQALLVIANFNNFVHAPPVVEGWKIVRDVCNMFFVLVLLVIAIGTILQQDKYHWTKLMPQFVAAAILINFSKVICGVLIDLAQVIMLTFVQAFSGAAGANFTVALGIPKILAASKNIQTFAGGTEAGDTTFLSIAATYLLAAIFVTVGLVVITIMTLILLMRIIALWFLVILSPFAFMFAVLPDTETYSKKWWTQFTNYVIVGPAMAFFLWLSLTVIQTQADGETNAKNISAGSILYSNTNQAKDAASAVDKNSLLDKSTGAQAGLAEIGSLDGMLSFLIGIGLMIGSLMAAQEMGVAGSNMAKGAISGMQDWAMGKKGPSPMRALRERYDAYQNIRKEQRQTKVKASAARIADVVGGAKALPGQLLRGVGKEIMATRGGQAVRSVAQRADYAMNNLPENARARRFLAGAVGQVIGGKHWEDRMSRGKAQHVSQAEEERRRAGELRAQGQTARASGDIRTAVERDAQAQRLENSAGRHEVAAGIDTLRLKVPTLTMQAGKLLAAGATGGMIDGLMPGGFLMPGIAPMTLPGASLAAASFYGPTALNAMRKDGEEQSVRAKMAEASAIAEEMKKFANMGVDALRSFAFGTRSGTTKFQQLGAQQAMVDRGLVTIDELGGIRGRMARESNSSSLDGLEGSILSTYPRQAYGMTDDRFMSMVLSGQIDAKKLTANSVQTTDPANPNTFAQTLHQMSVADPAVATRLKTTQAGMRGAYQKLTESISKDNAPTKNQLQAETNRLLTAARAAGGITQGAGAATTFTDAHDRLIQMNIQMGGTAHDSLGIPAAGGAAGTALAPEVENFIRTSASDQQRVGNLLGFGEGVFTNDTRVRELIVNAMQDRRVFGSFVSAGRAATGGKQDTARAVIEAIANTPGHQRENDAIRQTGR